MVETRPTSPIRIAIFHYSGEFRMLVVFLLFLVNLTVIFLGFTLARFSPMSRESTMDEVAMSALAKEK